MTPRLMVLAAAILFATILAGCSNDTKPTPDEQQKFFQKGPPPPGGVPGANGQAPSGATGGTAAPVPAKP